VDKISEKSTWVTVCASSRQPGKWLKLLQFPKVSA